MKSLSRYCVVIWFDSDSKNQFQKDLEYKK